jgi:hypothetical protein
MIRLSRFQTVSATTFGTVQRLSVLMLACAVMSVSVSAQYLTSARAGFVNRVEGKVFIQRTSTDVAEASEAPGRASLGTQMKDGDHLITNGSGRAEVLLSPGSWLRLNSETKMCALQTSFSQMRFELVSGSIIAEVSAEENTNISASNPLEIVTPHGSVLIARTGVYRVDSRQGETVARVYKGELYLGSRDQVLKKTALKVSKEKYVVLSNRMSGTPEIAKLNDYYSDDFDQWSVQRAQSLLAAHQSVLRRNQSFSMVSTMGSWYFDPFYNCYTFIPAGRRWASGYGFSFYNNLSNCACNLWYWTPYYGSGPYNNAGTTVGSSVVPTTAPRTFGDTDRVTTAVRETNVGRRVDISPPSVYSPDFGSRSVDSGASVVTAPRDFGSRSIDSGSSVSSPVSSGRTDAGGGRSADTGGGGRSSGRTVN